MARDLIEEAATAKGLIPYSREWEKFVRAATEKRHAINQSLSKKQRAAARSMAYYGRNKEKRNAARRQWGERNREKAREYSKQHYYKNKKAILRRQKKHYEANTGYYRVYQRKYYLKRKNKSRRGG